MDKLIEQFAKDEIKQTNRDSHRATGLNESITNAHYRGVIDGRKIAYEDVLKEIGRLRRLP